MRNLVLTAALWLAVPAFAQVPSEGPDAPAQPHVASPEVKAARQAMRQACMQDVRSLCAGSQAGGGKILMCLRDHRDQVSEGCKAAVQHLRDIRKGA